MFGWRKKSSQAKRKAPAKQSPSFRWRRSYNWIFLLLPLAAAGYQLHRMDAILPIRTVMLSGEFQHLDQAEIEQVLRAYIGQGFFSLDIRELQHNLHTRDWTESVSIRRVWPDKLRVRIVEKKPIARWDDRHLLSTTARVYRADTKAFAHLPRVHARNHEPALALQRFHSLKASFEQVGERLVALEIDSRGSIDVELINGLQIRLGRDDIERKVARLASIYDAQILPRREQIERLDMRYSNGFAVAWKNEVLQGRDKASIWSNSNV
jgi:cell division protein FtsQ